MSERVEYVVQYQSAAGRTWYEIQRYAMSEEALAYISTMPEPKRYRAIKRTITEEVL